MRYFILLIPFLQSCSNNYGYIYDYETEQPLEKVIVQDILSSKNRVLTDKNGFFSFTECDDLIIFKEGYKKDTLSKYGCKPNGKCFNGKKFYMKKLEKE